MAATVKGTRRRRRMELDHLDRIARAQTPLAYGRIPGPIRRRRLERLHKDLASGKVTLPGAAA